MVNRQCGKKEGSTPRKSSPSSNYLLMKKTERSVIYAEDIMYITGRSKSYAYNILSKIKAYFKKTKHQLVTFEEYAEFHGIPIEMVMDYIRSQE